MWLEEALGSINDGDTNDITLFPEERAHQKEEVERISTEHQERMENHERVMEAIRKEDERHRKWMEDHEKWMREHKNEMKLQEEARLKRDEEIKGLTKKLHEHLQHIALLEKQHKVRQIVKEWNQVWKKELNEGITLLHTLFKQEIAKQLYKQGYRERLLESTTPIQSHLSGKDELKWVADEYMRIKNSSAMSTSVNANSNSFEHDGDASWRPHFHYGRISLVRVPSLPADVTSENSSSNSSTPSMGNNS